MSLILIYCQHDSDPPEVEILQPEEGSILTGTVVVEAVVRENDALSVADLRIDNTVVYVNEDIDTLMTYQWNTDEETEGEHSVIAYARDKSENAASDTVVVSCGSVPYPDSLVATIDLSFSPGIIVLSADYGFITGGDEIMVLDLSSHQIIAAINGRATDLDIDATEEFIYAPDSANNIYKIDPVSHTLVDSIAISNPYQGCIDQSDTIYYVVTFDQDDIYSFNTINLCNDSVNDNTGIDSIGFVPDVSYANKTVYIADYTNYFVLAIGVPEGEVTEYQQIDIVAAPFSVQSSTSQQEVYIGTENPDRGLVFISTESNSELDTISRPNISNGHALAVTPDGNYLFAADYNNSKVWICSTEGRTIIDSLDIPTVPYSVAVSSDGENTYVTSREQNKIYIYGKR